MFALAVACLGALRVSVREGVAVGHVAPWRIDGRLLNATTLSLHPLAFEVRGFLSASECVELRRTATPRLETSDTQAIDAAWAEREAAQQLLQPFDMDEDGSLSAEEVRLTLERWFDVALSSAHVAAALTDAGLPPPPVPLHGAFASLAVRSRLTTWVMRLQQREPAVRNRVSSQAWLHVPQQPPPPPLPLSVHGEKEENETAATANEKKQVSASSEMLLESLSRRLGDLTQLPAAVLGRDNVQLQVVSYGMGGHYNHHHDSTHTMRASTPCCHLIDTKQPCKTCRFLTVLYYLNGGEHGDDGGDDGDGDVGAALTGGETVFPVAGQPDMDKDGFYLSQHSNQSRYCGVGGGSAGSMGLRVAPEMGKAVLFYSHHLDEERGWKGELDWTSMHASCPVRAGRKWLANHWVQLADTAWEEVAHGVKQKKKREAAAARPNKGKKRKKKKKKKRKKKKAADEL